MIRNVKSSIENYISNKNMGNLLDIIKSYKNVLKSMVKQNKMKKSIQRASFWMVQESIKGESESGWLKILQFASR